MEKQYISKIENHKTPFYFYDLELLKRTLDIIKTESDKYNYHVHYALKANANDKILSIIESYGLGADCVSGNEVKRSVESGFSSNKIVYAGVGKSDDEIIYSLEHNILCFNCESIQEIEIIDELAKENNKVANIALRINPNVDAKTHKYVTTGLEENKFGIGMWEMESIVEKLKTLKNVKLTGLHFHIGSQITDLDVFRGLCIRVNEIQQWFFDRHIIVDTINVGGGLGIDYENPDENSIPDFEKYFSLFNQFLDLLPNQELHFELGRSIVGQCGDLITKVLYVKNGINTNFAIVDAGMSDLIRPALYQSYHKIQNITSNGKPGKYDVVGPICESSDCFGKAVTLPETKRKDIIAIRSTGAYGEVMASQYNLRDLPSCLYSDEI